MIASLKKTRLFRFLRDEKEQTSYWGRLGSRLVESDKRVIVYDMRGVLHASDTIEEATRFYAQTREEGQASGGTVFVHRGKEWEPVAGAGANLDN
jgi:hypothetical protein